MKQTWVVIAIAVSGIGCNSPSTVHTPEPQPAEAANKPAPADALQIAIRSPNQVMGQLQRQGVTLRFDARLGDAVGTDARKRRSSVLLTRSDGSELLRIEYDGDQTRMSVMSRLQVRVPAGDVRAEQVTSQGDAQAFALLATVPEFSVLERLSVSLDKEGVDGSAYPVAQPLHEWSAHARSLLAARRNSKLVSNALRAPCPPQQCGIGEFWNEETCSCEPVADPNPPPGGVMACSPRGYSDLRSDPCKNNCKGMCGPKCDCWPLICGDCGYHGGCNFHDEQCGDCYASWGLNLVACTICGTSLNIIVAEVGCNRL